MTMLKPISFVLLLTILTVSFRAQITVDGSDMPIVGHQYISESVIDLFTIDVISTGSGYNWDFSWVFGMPGDTLNPVSVSSTPLAYQFFFNNPLLYPDHLADYAIASEDIGSSGVVSLSDRFEYFRDDASGHKITGSGANLNGIPTSIQYDQIDVIYDFPMNFGNTHSSEGSYMIDIPTVGAYGQEFFRNKEVDGWGTVTTPYGSFDCLRVKTELTITDSLYLDTIGLGSSIPTATNFIYDWIAKDEGIPVFTATTNSLGIVTSASYLNEHLTAIDPGFDHSVKLFPNPTSEALFIESDQSGSFSIYALSGRLVSSGVFGAFSKVDLSLLGGGLYLMVMTVENGGVLTKKIEILH